jgi:hypothetical protein
MSVARTPIIMKYPTTVFTSTVLGWIATFIWVLTEKSKSKRDPVWLDTPVDPWDLYPEQLKTSRMIERVKEDDHWVLGIEE